VALAGAAALHGLVGSVPSLAERPWVVAAALLATAGAAQFLPLTRACLRACRHPYAFLLTRFRPGVAAAFRLGRDHGLYCLGCCWALMLVMFAAGVADLWWMAGLTAVMVYENGRARLVADVMAVDDVPLSWDVEGRCAFATDFDYRSGSSDPQDQG
jgi:predicted metal-binding membrane protein